TEDDFLLATDHPGDLLGDPLGIPSGDIHNYSGNVKQLENSEKSSVLTIAEGSGRKQNYTREDLNL
ncbi:MAG: hypothetical protein RJA81_680, partial [Planctomycetota bacterium]